MPLKYQGFIGKIYDRQYKPILSPDAERDYFLFYPPGTTESLYNHKVEFEAKFDVSKFKVTDDVLAQSFFYLKPGLKIWSAIQLAFSSGRYRLHTTRQSVADSKNNSASSFTYITLTSPYFYFRLVHEGTKDYAYYSTNGSSWTLFNTYTSLPASEFYDVSVRSDSHATKPEDIKLVIDGKLVFGKIE